jgi:predicted enzyme related to lactoylglutathione lyase
VGSDEPAHDRSRDVIVAEVRRADVAEAETIGHLLHDFNIDRSAAYYRDRLGFTCELYGDPPDFLVAERDDAIVLTALCEDPDRIVPNWQIVDKVWNLYIRVDDVEAIYAEFQRRGAPIDYTLYDAPSGFREFGVQDPDGHDIAVGQRSDHGRQGDG